MLKNYLEIDNYNAALRWYTCTHTVYPLFNDIYKSKCALAAVLLPSQLPLMSGRINPFYFRVPTGNWQLIGNYAILAKNSHRVFLYENGELNSV